MLVEVIGWVGALLFSMCAVPQCIKTWRTKSAGDLSWMFLFLWLGGEILTTFYVVATNLEAGQFQYPLLANYLFNTLLVCYLIYGKWRY